MHSAGGYLDQKTRSPVSMGAAIAINGGIIAALLLSNPDMIPKPPTIIDLINVTPPPEPKPLPPEPIKQKLDPKPAPQSHVTPTQTIFPPKENTFTTETVITPPPPVTGTIGTGTETVAQDPSRPSVFVGPKINSRYMSAFQPPYPPGKQRLGEEGVVVVRVLVGPDGRVKQVERISADDHAFYAATVQQALKKWRFTPATRDGVPVEGWREMTVRFEMTD